MKQALVFGSTGGIGAALVHFLQTQGMAVTGLSRRDGFDLTRPDSMAPVLAGLTGPFDQVWIATGILAPPGLGPEKALSRVDAGAMLQVMAVNAIGPALILSQLPRLLPRDRPSRIGVLSARVGSIGDNRLGGWHSYRASKAALNQIVRGAAVELSRTHPLAVLAALHPGTVDTEFTAGYAGHDKQSPTDAAARLVGVLAALNPEQSGGFYDHQGVSVPW